MNISTRFMVIPKSMKRGRLIISINAVLNIDQESVQYMKKSSHNFTSIQMHLKHTSMQTLTPSVHFSIIKQLKHIIAWYFLQQNNE